MVLACSLYAMQLTFVATLYLFANIVTTVAVVALEQMLEHLSLSCFNLEILL
jgi:hypothetical protein